jgi:cell division protein FtsB
MMETSDLFSPVLQSGFLGFSVVLLGVVIWLIKRLLSLLDVNNRIIAANTQAINDLTKMTNDLLSLNRSVHDKLLSRPCIAERERKH